jgi:nucleotide-binding universal stress UspA family protein
MINLKKILVPTDFSVGSEVALRYARELATAFQAQLHILHVLEDPIPYTSVEAFAVPVQFYQDLEKSVRQRMEQVLDAEDRQKFDAQLTTEQGSPFVQIIKYAKANEMDLIVMGTHGRGPIAHMLLGSVAEKVVRKAPCPVLTVRHPEHEFVKP